MGMVRKIVTMAVAATLAFAAAAQTSIQVQTHNVVDLNEQFNVTFIIEGENSASDFSWECPADFDLVWGPQKSSSSSISIINGKRTSSRQVSYTYILMPKSVGDFTLPPATAKVKGDGIVSRAVSISVIRQDSGSSGQSGQTGIPSDPSAAGGQRNGGQGSSQSGNGQSGSQGGNGSGNARGNSRSGSEQASTGDIFLDLSLDRTNVVAGQPVYEIGRAHV